jgi:hypothetical protein
VGVGVEEGEADHMVGVEKMIARKEGVAVAWWVKGRVEEGERSEGEEREREEE